MIPRYLNKTIDEIWSDVHKTALWQKVELALIDARYKLGRIAFEISNGVRSALHDKPIDLAWWNAEDKRIHHDLNAAVHERQRHLPPELACEYHKDDTSYDVQEPAMALALTDSARLVLDASNELKHALREKAIRYRFTPELQRTHNQWAQIQSFGYRCLAWHEDLSQPHFEICAAMSLLRFSKMSGAIGNNAEIDPELERIALGELGLEPYHGATQIIPRSRYAPLAAGLSQLASSCEKIATDIRLAAGSGRKTLEEPFDVNQEGSSAMPQKRNPILCEQLCGLADVARKYAAMLEARIPTWEGRSIEQSCVERIAWPDLFHTVMRMLTVLTKVIKGLNVYPDNMMREIAMSAGTYAANAAKTFLAEHGKEFGITAKDAYGIVRLAAHIAFETPLACQLHRVNLPNKLEDADEAFEDVVQAFRDENVFPESIEWIICKYRLHARTDIGVDAETAVSWNNKLRQAFDGSLGKQWQVLFLPSRGMKNEANAFEQVFKV